MSQQSTVEEQSFVSVRLVTMDHYMASPVPDLDPVYSSFRSSVIYRVPVLRIFGPTLAGQKTCLHIHGIFPYMYVPKPTGASEGFIYQLAGSIDKALNISMLSGGESKVASSRHHVYKIVEVKGRPFYGYHPIEHQFLKIYFYSPWMVKRAADMLQSGAIMGRVLQPHYSHIPYTLQFMMDYNLQGMNLIHLSHCLFRCQTLAESSAVGDNDDWEVHEDLKQRLFFEKSLPSELKVPEDLKRSSMTELEIDAVAADVLNTNVDLMQSLSLSASVLENHDHKKMMNPGLEALWDDERFRREELGINGAESLSPPDSPKRKDSDFETSSQKFWSDRFSEALEKLKLDGAIKSQDSLPSDSDPNATVNFVPGKKNASNFVYAAEALSHSILPDATSLEEHVPSLSQSITASFQGSPCIKKSRLKDKSSQNSEKFDETIIDLDILSQTISSQKLSLDEEDEELVLLLAGLEEEKKAENNEACDNEIIPELEKPRKEYLDAQDDLEMSQVCFDSDPFFALDADFEASAKRFSKKVEEEAEQKDDKRSNVASMNASLDWDDDSFWTQITDSALTSP